MSSAASAQPSTSSALGDPAEPAQREPVRGDLRQHRHRPHQQRVQRAVAHPRARAGPSSPAPGRRARRRSPDVPYRKRDLGQREAAQRVDVREHQQDRRRSRAPVAAKLPEQRHREGRPVGHRRAHPHRHDQPYARTPHSARASDPRPYVHRRRTPAPAAASRGPQPPWTTTLRVATDCSAARPPAAPPPSRPGSANAPSSPDPGARPAARPPGPGAAPPTAAPARPRPSTPGKTVSGSSIPEKNMPSQPRSSGSRPSPSSSQNALSATR